MINEITKELVEQMLGHEVAAFKVEKIETETKIEYKIIARPKLEAKQITITIKPKP